MKISYWTDRWENNRLGWHRSGVNPDLERFYERLGLSEEDTILVPLCGKSVDLIWLAGKGPGVIGVDVAERAAKQFVREHKLDVTLENRHGFTVYRTGRLSFWVGDFLGLEAGMIPDATAVYDRAALVALPRSMRREYVQKIDDLAAPSVRILLSTYEYSRGVLDPPPFSVERREVEALYGAEYSLRPLSTEKLDPNGADREGYFRKQVYLIRREG